MSFGSSFGRRSNRPAGGHRPVLSRRFARARGASAAPDRPRAPSRAGGHEVVLEVSGLKTYFFTYDGIVRALDGVNLTVRRGETTGIVGETGCGKSVTAFSIDRLVGEPGRVVSGQVLFRGVNLLWGLDKEAKFKRIKDTGRVKVVRSFRRIKAGSERMAAVRGRGIAMIFQEPSQAMNPVFSISDQLGETVLLHRGVEVIDGLLGADRGGAVELVTELAAGMGGGGGELGVAVDQLLQKAEAGNSQELREAAEAVGKLVGVPSVAAELYYLLRTAGPRAPKFRTRVFRALDRLHLTSGQRRYLRHERRLAVLTNRINEVYLKEMQLGRSLGFQRRRLRARIRFEKLRATALKIPFYKRRVMAPLKTETFWRTVMLLEGVRIANPAQIARCYPHELSGGMLQRVMIAMALCSDPEVLLADEPTTALDVTIQMQILELMQQLRERIGTAIVLITHDLGVVAEVCDRVNVMYAGLVVETAPVKELFRRPLHPYTQGLLSAIPRMDRPDKELASIPGSVPNLITPPSGCRFHPRCPYAMPICKERRPELLQQGEAHGVACFLYEDVDVPHGEETAPLERAPETVAASTA
jgi:peptide/nickel transport system ATP-binding protein